MQGMEGKQKEGTRRACCSDPGRDDGDTWARTRALEVETNGESWYIPGRQRSISDLESIPLACFPSIHKVNLREVSCSKITEYGSVLIVHEALRIETWRWH